MCMRVFMFVCLFACSSHMKFNDYMKWVLNVDGSILNCERVARLEVLITADDTNFNFNEIL